MRLATLKLTSGQVSGIETMREIDAELNEGSASRALTVIETPTRGIAAPRRDAAFLAHLIATRAQAPQTRARRRAEPAEALARYRAVAGLV
jgi:hypothetical protein